MIGLNFKEYTNIQKECEKLARNKNHDYGNDSLKSFGNLGILIRISDKVDRLKTFQKKGILNVKDEKIEDTLKDIINYAIYMIMQGRDKLDAV